MANIFEWSGAGLGLLGAFLLATNSRASRYGWIAFLPANVAMIAYALSIDAHGLLIQQVGFVCTSVLGLQRTGLLRPLSMRAREPRGPTASE